MKIFFVIKSLFTAGGTERMTTLVANELAKRGHQVGIIALMKEGEAFFEINPAVKIYYLYPKKDKRASLIRDFSRRKLLRKLYLSEQPDIIVFSGSGRSMLNIPSARGFKTITWEHTNANTNWHLMHSFSRKLAVTFCDRVVTLTERDAENYRRKFGAKNAVCIYNPTTFQRKKAADLSQKNVLAVGRLSKEKGFDLLLDIWNKTYPKNKEWKLRILGDGPLKAELEQKIAKLKLGDSVKLVPFTKNIEKEYEKASIFTLTSRREGFGLVIVESMTLGVPVISFDCETGPREIIDHNKTGILVPTLNVEIFADELDKLMKDEKKRNSLAQNGLKKAENFSVDKIINQWEKLLEEIKDS